jgi:hypothetical protein
VTPYVELYVRSNLSFLDGAAEDESSPQNGVADPEEPLLVLAERPEGHHRPAGPIEATLASNEKGSPDLRPRQVGCQRPQPLAFCTSQSRVQLGPEPSVSSSDLAM